MTVNKQGVSGAPDISAKGLLKLILPSLLGIFVFLTPITVDGNSTIVMGLVMNFVRAPIDAVVPQIIIAFVFFTVLGALVYLTLKPQWMLKRPVLLAMCETTPGWFGMRLLGLAVTLMVFFSIGPDLIRAPDTGGTAFGVIGPALFFTVGVACVLLPLLTDFGLLEFTGTLLRRPFEAIFTLPGRAAIDATSSLVAAASVGLLITFKQYEDGRYSAREAASVATNFSVVSLPFSLVVATTAKVDHVFFPWYLSVIAACILCAAVMVRLKPLSALPDTYYEPVGKTVHEERDDTYSLLGWATREAVRRAESAPPPHTLALSGFQSALITLARVMGPSLAIATIASILVFHSPVVEVAAWPVYQLLDVFGLPEAQKAAPGVIGGFLEMLIPSLVAASIDSDLVRFVLAGLSVSQLIYMSEVGVLILRSKLPLGFLDLCRIFLLRTLILFPLLLLAGWLLA